MIFAARTSLFCHSSVLSCDIHESHYSGGVRALTIDTGNPKIALEDGNQSTRVRPQIWSEASSTTRVLSSARCTDFRGKFNNASALGRSLY